MAASVHACARAVLFGASAAVAPMLLLTIVLGIDAMIRTYARGDTSMSPALYIVVLPLTAPLKQTHRGSERAYMASGAIVGALVPIVGLLAVVAPAGYWMGLLGAPGGAVTGRTWWLAARRPR